MEYKKSMDAVLQLGNVIQYHLETQRSHEGSGEPLYPNLAKYLKVKLVHDIAGSTMPQKLIKRQARIPILTPDGWKDEKVDSEKVLRALMSWVTMSIMWLKPIQGAGNGVHGMLLTHRDALKGKWSKMSLKGINDGDIDFEPGDLIKAEAEYWTYVRDAARGKTMQNKMFLMARHLNYFGNNFDYAMMEKALITKSVRYASPQSMYMFHTMPEEFLSMTTMVATLRHMKVEKTGKSIWDSYEVAKVEGTQDAYDVKWVGGSRGVVFSGSEVVGGEKTGLYTKLEGLSFQEIQKIKRVHERLQGGYRREEAAYIEAYVLGKFFIQLKKYYPRLIINGFHAPKLDGDLGYYKQMIDKDGKPIYRTITKDDGTTEQEPVWEWQKRFVEGRWRTLMAVLMYTLSGGQFKKSHAYESLRPEQWQNIYEAVITMVFFSASYGLYLLMFSDADDDDTAKKWWKMYLVDNLSQQYNIYDLLKTLKTGFTPVAATKLFQTADALNSMLFGGINYAITGDEGQLFTREGDMKGFNNLMKQIPFAAQVVDMKNKFENAKSTEDFFSEFGYRLK